MTAPDLRDAWRLDQNWFFDCDGVLLDSNDVKTQAFYTVALDYGEPAAAALRDYHRLHGGISRFRKWEYFFESILGRRAEPGEYERAVSAFAERSRNGVMSAAVDPAALELLGRIGEAGGRSFVVSGAAEDELIDALAHHGILPLVESAFGSPRTKEEILDRLRAEDPTLSDGVFVGDSRADHAAATRHGLDFVFVEHWTEFDEWESHFDEATVRIIHDLRALIPVR